jgi:hypothetical protein
MPVGREVRYRGTLTGPQKIDGAEFRITPETRIDERPAVGEEAEVRGVVAEDGGIEATRFRDRRAIRVAAGKNLHVTPTEKAQQTKGGIIGGT